MKLPPIDEITSVTQINEWIDRWIMEILDIPISLSTNKNIDEEKVELFSATRFLKGKTNGEIKAEIVNHERLYNEDVYKRLYDENGYDRDPYTRDLNAKIKDVTDHFCKIKNLHDKINGVGRYHFYAPKYTELREWKSERISLYNELQELIETPMSFDVDDNTSMPETHNQTDFSHMESFTPIIPFDMGKLYHFLIQEGVIRNIDMSLFSDCISHGHINELWENGVKYRLKLVCHRLKDKYCKEWFQKVCENLNLSAEDMGKFNGSKRKEFEDKLQSVIRKREFTTIDHN